MKRKYWTLSIQLRFIEVFETTANISAACRVIGFSRTAVYRRRKRDQEFADAWAEAEQVAADALEAELWRRGVEGIDRPIMHQGKQVGTVKEYSDLALIALIKARRPEQFNEHLEATKSGSGLAKIDHVISLRRRNDSDPCT